MKILSKLALALLMGQGLMEQGWTTQMDSPPAVVLTSQNDVNAKSLKLVHVKSNITLVEFAGEETIIHDRILEKEMLERGVLIPPSLRGLYHGKEAVRLGEEGFQKAFKEIFAVNIFSSSSYAWQE